MTPVSAREVAGFDLEALAARLREVAVHTRGLNERADRTTEDLSPDERTAVLDLADAVTRVSLRFRGLDR